jgi:NAD/NADP transhydrogenase beta subunit
MVEELEKLSNIKALNEDRKKVEIEQGLETLSRYLDGLFRIPGTGWRFGLDGVVGLIPNYGDIATSLVSFYILIAGVRYGVPKITLLRMAINIALDYGIGAIPFIGDLFDFFYKSNQRNMQLIRERATGQGKGTASDWIFVFIIIALLIAILAASVVISLAILVLIASYLGGGFRTI